MHDVLRERRAAKPLLSIRELQLREAARRRDEEEALAQERVERWQLRQKSVDAEGKLAPAVYRSIFARSRQAYYGSRHWSRRSRAQLELTPVCEVTRCGRAADLRARHLHYDALGEEQTGSDLITLCDGCLSRALKREQELGRPVTFVPHLVPLDGPVQRRLQFEPGGRFGAHRLVEELASGPSLLLGPVHGGVGVPQERFGRHGVP